MSKNPVDLRQILVDLYGQDQPIPKFAKDIGRTRQTIYRWLAKGTIPKMVKKYLIMKLKEKPHD